MKHFKTLLAGLVAGILFMGGALAQPVGQLSQGQVWGNFSASPGPASPTDMMTFPVISGNAAVFNGTTGKLKDGGSIPANAKSLGIKQDGIAVTATVSITSGTGALTATGATFASTDVGKYILVPGAGTAGGYLVTTIASFSDATHVGLTANASTTVTATAKTVTWCTDDSANIAAAVTTVLAAGKTIVFNDGIVCHSGTLNWAFNNLHVQFASDDTTFIHTGSGVANSFNGMLNYPGSQGAVNAVFGGPGRPMLRGNPNGNSTSGVKVDNWHFSYMKVAIHDATVGLLGTDSGVVGSSAVESVFDIRVSGLASSGDGPFIIVPQNGINFTKPAGSIFERPQIEGTGAGGNRQVVFTGAAGIHIRSGTIESGLAGGVTFDSTSTRNLLESVDSEVNVASDWSIAGTYNTLINCNGGAITISGTNTILIGGKYGALTNTDNRLYSLNTEFVAAGTNSGSNTTVINPIGGFITAIDAAINTLANKVINTANGLAFSINSKSVTDLSGSGSVLATTNGPTFIAPNLGTPSAATLTNATGLPISSGVSGLATGVATFLGTPSSANLAAALTDEDGTGVVPFETTGTWTPTDQSGAALTFTSVNCKYTKIGNMIHAYGTFTFPTTASGATNSIGGLPFTVPNSSYAATSNPVKATAVGISGIIAVPVINTTTFQLWNNAGAINLTNTSVSTSTITVNIVYPAT